MTGWRYYWRRYLSWVPFQPCFGCGKWYWGGMPTEGWCATDQEYCSERCYRECEL